MIMIRIYTTRRPRPLPLTSSFNLNEVATRARPSPYQLFVPHPRVFDLVIQPSLRDLMCQAEYPDVRWIPEGATTM